MNKKEMDKIINSLIELYFKFDFDYDFNSIVKKTTNKYNISESYNIACEFFKSFDNNMYNAFINTISFDKKSFLFVSKDINHKCLDNNNHVVLGTGKTIIGVENNINDIYGIVHEFTHKYNLQIGKKMYNKILCEVGSITSEMYLRKYLENTKHEEDAYNYIYNRLMVTMYYCFFIKYVEFLNSDVKILIIRSLNREYYNEEINKKINLIDDVKLKKIFLDNFDLFEKDIDRQSLSLIDYNQMYRYIYAMFVSPYIYYNNDMKLLNEINLGMYDKNFSFNKISDNDVKNSLERYFSDIKVKFKNVKLYEGYNTSIVSNRLINLLADNGITELKNLGNLELKENINITESFNIVFSFLKKFDINLYNMFINMIENDKESFVFLNKDINEDNYNSINNDGKVTIAIRNNIKDVFTIVHEFVHKVYFQKDISSKVIFDNYTEVAPITVELYLYKYLTEFTEYGLDAEKVMKENYFYEILSCFYISYVNFIKEIFKNDPWNTINMDNYEDVFNKEVQKLPEIYKKMFIKYHKQFDSLIKEDGTELENKLNFRFRYVNGLYFASYIFLHDDRELFDKMGVAAYDEEITLPLNYSDIDECFYNYFNKFVNKADNISRIR